MNRLDAEVRNVVAACAADTVERVLQLEGDARIRALMMFAGLVDSTDTDEDGMAFLTQQLAAAVATTPQATLQAIAVDFNAALAMLERWEAMADE